MRKLVLGILVCAMLLVTAVVGVGQSTVLLDDDLESYALGALPIGSSETWCYLDAFSGPSDWPQIEQADGEHGQVLHFSSLGANSRQQVGAIIDVPALSDDEVLDLSFDLFLNAPSRYFRLNLRDVYYRSSGATGCATEDPRAPVFTLGDVMWNGDLTIGVSSSTNPTEPNGPRDEAVCDATLLTGQWYSFRLVHAPGLLELYVDGEKVGELENSTYDLSEEYDWMLLLGDGSSNSPWVSDVLVDNLLLQVLSAQTSQQEEESPPLGATVPNTLAVPGDYPTIQAAIDASSPGDTVEISPGIYQENLQVYSQVNLIARTQEGEEVILQVSQWDLPMCTISLSEALSVSISGIAFQDSWGERAVVVEGLSVVSLDSCSFKGNFVDIQAYDSSDVSINDCEFRECYDGNVQVFGAATMEITNSRIVATYRVSSVKALEQSICIISNCSFTGPSEDLKTSGTTAVFVGGASSVTVSDCSFDRFSSAVGASSSSPLVVERNVIRNCVFGVHVLIPTGTYSEGLSVIGNDMMRCANAGIALFGTINTINISDNIILYTEGGDRAISLCLPVCGCGSELPPFEGTITGTGNDIRNYIKGPCPPFNSPFWPEGFVK